MRRVELTIPHWPETDDELWHLTRRLWGVEIPRHPICESHEAPFRAFADLYFGRGSMHVIKAPRGFGGKTFLAATLAATITVAQAGARVTCLGGSGEQSRRLIEHTTDLWTRPLAPRALLDSDPSRTSIRLTSGSRMQALTASQRSVRGPHDQVLLADEIDEMDLRILDAAMGQTMATEDVPARTALLSTWHRADGTYREMRQRAIDRGWPMHEWCWRETCSGTSPSGFVAPAEVERKRAEVSDEMWRVEYEGGEPALEGRAISEEWVDWTFDRALGEWEGRAGEACLNEPPERDAEYWHGADWAKHRDWTCYVVLRADTRPMRLVYFERTNRRAWPAMAGRWDKLRRTYPPAASAHDATGVGDVVGDLLTEPAMGVRMTGQVRRDLFARAITSIESREIKSPRIKWAYELIRYTTVEDLESPSGHPPDALVALAMALHAGHHARAPRIWSV